MKQTVLVSILIACLSHAQAADMSEEQKTLYAAGVMLANPAKPLDLTTGELESLKKGLTDALSGAKLAVDMDTYGPKVQAFAQTRIKALAAKNLTAGKEFADKAAKEKGAVKTESGLVFVSLKDGNGASPAASDTVKVHYRGTLIDGQEFDSSYKRGQPAEFPLNGVIKCWTEGLQKMKVGGKARLTCPAPIAYGESGRPGIPPNATLRFEVELLEISKAAVQKEAEPQKK